MRFGYRRLTVMLVREGIAANHKRVQCEMGGKNALVVLEDADLDLAAAATADGAFGSTGQRCTATSRVVVAKVKTRIMDDLRAGYAYLKRDRVILSGSVVMAFSNVGLYMVEANFVFYLVGLRHMRLWAVGIVLGAQGVGSVVGAAIAPRLGARIRAGPLVIGSLTAAGLATALLVPARSLPAIAAAWGVVGVFTMLVVVTWFTLRQRTIPSELFGRVVGFSRMLAFATIAPASIAGGAILGLTHSPATLAAASAAVQVGVALIGWFTALRTAGTAAPVSPPAAVPGAREPAASGG